MLRLRLVCADLSRRFFGVAVWSAMIFSLLGGTAFALAPAPLTLPTDVSMPLENNLLRTAAMADTRIAAAAVPESNAPLMPKILFGENVTGGGDPGLISASELNRQPFTAVDFAINKLDSPSLLTNWPRRVLDKWNLFGGLQSWYAGKRANFAQQASDQRFERPDRLVQARYEVLAQTQLAVAQDGLKRAEAAESSSLARFEMPDWAWIVVMIVAYVVVTQWLLPKLGVPT